MHVLYHQDAYLKSFESVVEDVRDDGVALAQTAFYPTGGGQPHDKGTLTFCNGELRVVEVRRRGGVIWHTVVGDRMPSVGDRVHGLLDWDRRYLLMRTHTAMHILCGVIWRDYRASVTGGNMKPGRGRMDFEFAAMKKELVQDIERSINEEVRAERSIRTAFLPRKEAFNIPDLIRTKINLLPEHIQEVRIVEIEGLDLQADGGTHVANTSEVGPMRIVDYKSKGAINKRLVVELE